MKIFSNYLFLLIFFLLSCGTASDNEKNKQIQSKFILQINGTHEWERSPYRLDPDNPPPDWRPFIGVRLLDFYENPIPNKKIFLTEKGNLMERCINCRYNDTRKMRFQETDIHGNAIFQFADIPGNSIGFEPGRHMFTATFYPDEAGNFAIQNEFLVTLGE